MNESPMPDKVIRKPKMPIIYETSPDGDKMDPECVSICNALNLLEGIETISSCCGHGFQPFRIYFVAEFLNDLKPIMELIDESEIWRVRVSMATGNMEIYFILESANGWADAYGSANELTELIAQRAEKE